MAYQEPKPRSIRLDDDVYEALQKLPESPNKFLRKVLSANGVFDPPPGTPLTEVRGNDVRVLTKPKATPKRLNKYIHGDGDGSAPELESMALGPIRQVAEFTPAGLIKPSTARKGITK